jgi:hypothetical protein
MKFIMLIYNDPALLSAVPQEQFNETMRGCLAHADELKRKGTVVESQMLQPASSAKSVRVRGGRRMVMDGPFAETKELLAGFNLIEADDMEHALQIAAAFPWADTGCIEVREILDIETVRQQVTAA